MKNYSVPGLEKFLYSTECGKGLLKLQFCGEFTEIGVFSLMYPKNILRYPKNRIVFIKGKSCLSNLLGFQGEWIGGPANV